MASYRDSYEIVSIFVCGTTLGSLTLKLRIDEIVTAASSTATMASVTIIANPNYVSGTYRVTQIRQNPVSPLGFREMGAAKDYCETLLKFKWQPTNRPLHDRELKRSRRSVAYNSESIKLVINGRPS